MVSEWPIAIFESQFAEPLRNGLTRPKAVRGTGIKMVNMGELFAHSRIGDIPMDRVQVSSSEAQRFLLSKGDLLFARQSLVLSGAGKCSIFTGLGEPVTYEGHLIRARIDTKVASPDFYYYFFNSPIGRQAIQGIAEQVAAAGIRGSDLAKLRVPLPPLPEQHAIARVLGALDDKIELNRRMNETLEALARALFQSWFVDFDPVRAKREGRQPAGMDAETAALFPGSFEASELGDIPAGWRVSTIGQEVQCMGGGTPSTSEADYWRDGTFYWATPKDLSGLQDPLLLNTERRVTEAGLQRISSGLLPVGTVLLSSRAPVGYLAIAGVPISINQGFIAMICDGGLSNYYVYHWTQANMETIKGRANGTTFQEISKSNFRPIPVVVPPKPLVGTFSRHVSGLFAKIECNIRESQTLAATRDALLPKLLSGEVRAATVEEGMETAA